MFSERVWETGIYFSKHATELAHKCSKGTKSNVEDKYFLGALF